MRGGAQSHLMRCSDQAYYVVKFQNNPQGVRILANELLGTRLAARMGLPTPVAAVVEVHERLIEETEDLVIQLGRGRLRCRAGQQFGSRYPGAPGETVVYDFLPDEQLREVANLSDFCGMLVFDKWTCNTNGRQAIFLREKGTSRYRAEMIGSVSMRANGIFPTRRCVDCTRGTACMNRCGESNHSIPGSSGWKTNFPRRFWKRRSARFRRSGAVRIATRWKRWPSNYCAGARSFAN